MSSEANQIGLSIKTSAQQIDVSKEFIRRLCEAGELEFFRVGECGMIRVTTISWRNYLTTVTAGVNVGQS